MSDLVFQNHVDPNLIDAAAQHLKDEGWAVIPNALSPFETEKVREDLWKVANELVDSGESYASFLDPNASNIRVHYLVEHGKIFRDLIEHPLAVEMVQRALGDKWIISNFTANIARPGSGSMGLHSDQSLVMPEPWLTDWALNVIWCVDDVYLENGATLFIPGSNKWTIKADIPGNVRELLRPFEAKAGSIVLMNGRVWHTSGRNITKDKDRAMMFGFYTKSYLRQQVNWTARLSDDLKQELCPELANRLGLNVQANDTVTELKYLDLEHPA
jgi:ectoine hydroxylase-related dioxygenase (phytanoyl-CoA dioxygenase family)